jgi:glycosidase
MRKKTFFLELLFILCSLISNAQNPTPDWAKNATIYEVNIRQFTPEGTFKAFETHLPRLKKMGVDILWLMPIHPIGVENRKGGLGSYYAISDYKAVNPEFGTLDEFKKLVKSAQVQGMKIIIDWVANHSSPDNVWVKQGHKDWYTLDSLGKLQPTIGTDWWDVADLNYDNKEMRKEMIASMKYWLTEANIDGFRCDVASWVPIDFWVEARKELDATKKVFMLAEAEELEMHQAFDMTYGWHLHHVMNEIAQGKKDVQEIYKYAKDNKHPKSEYRMHFTSNHDENSWNGTEMERMGESRFAFAVFAATFEGMPLVYNGQETSLDRRLKFFEKDSIDWIKMDLVPFYTKLLQLNRSNKALWNGESGGEVKFISAADEKNVLVFTREKDGNKVLVMINMTGNDQKVKLNNALLAGKYKELFSGKKAKMKAELETELEAWGYRVYYK